MFVLEDLLYSEGHLWVKPEDNELATIGLSDYAQEIFGEITSIDLPAEQEEIVKDDEFAYIETLTSGYDLYAPISGTVIEVNQSVLKNPDLITDDPYEDGWLIKVKMTQPAEIEELLRPGEYEEIVEEERLKAEVDMEEEELEDFEE